MVEEKERGWEKMKGEVREWRKDRKERRTEPRAEEKGGEERRGEARRGVER